MVALFIGKSCAPATEVASAGPCAREHYSRLSLTFASSNQQGHSVTGQSLMQHYAHFGPLPSRKWPGLRSFLRFVTVSPYEFYSNSKAGYWGVSSSNLLELPLVTPWVHVLGAY